MTKPSCANCAKPFSPLKAAPHKRFCSDQCRSEWHHKRSQQARARLDQEEAQAQQDKISEELL